MEYQTDEQLVRMYWAGDEASLQKLFARYEDPLYNFVRRYVGNAGDAEDIVQDAFVSAWKNIKKFDPDKKFKVWLFAIAKNAALNWIKKKKPALFSEFRDDAESGAFEESLESSAPLPDELFAKTRLSELLMAALDRLTPNQRLALILHYNDQLSFIEIAEVLDVSRDTAKSWHRRALMALRKLIVSSDAPEDAPEMAAWL